MNVVVAVREIKIEIETFTQWAVFGQNSWKTSEP